MAFDEVRFPVNISQGAKQGPSFRTLVTVTSTGEEQRVGQWSHGRFLADISYSIKNPTDMATAVAFFRARQGRLRGFRFKDWTDYKATAQALVNPYPLLVTQLQKTYSDSANSNVRPITKPVTGTVVVKEGSTTLTVTTHYSIDYATGLLTFAGGKPVDGAVYTWTGEFDVPVRFDVDDFLYTAEDVGILHCDNIPIIEVRR